MSLYKNHGNSDISLFTITVSPRTAAEIIRHIYALRKAGASINDIAAQLKREKVLIPSVYAQRKGFKNPTKRGNRG